MYGLAKSVPLIFLVATAHEIFSCESVESCEIEENDAFVSLIQVGKKTKALVANATEFANTVQLVKDDGDTKSPTGYYPSKAWVQSLYGFKGNPMVWAMSVVYGGLTAVALLAYLTWTCFGHDSELSAKRPRPDMGQPAGYS